MQERTGAHLEQIEAFAAVSEHLGIAAAARTLGRDASVISRRLDALEARLCVGTVKLFGCGRGEARGAA